MRLQVECSSSAGQVRGQSNGHNDNSLQEGQELSKDVHWKLDVQGWCRTLDSLQQNLRELQSDLQSYVET